MEVENNTTISNYTNMYDQNQNTPSKTRTDRYSTDSCDCRAWLSMENNFAAQK